MDPELEHSERLYNEDLAPAKERHWKTYSIFALWMTDVHNLGNYTFAAGLFVLGLSAWQVFVSVLVGFCVVFVAMNLMGRIGQRTAVPFPVVSRISFGVFGANVPALVRAIIAIFWYGIQTYLASVAILVLLVAVDPGLATLTHGGFLGLSPLGWISFVVLWALQLLVVTRGMETIRKFQDWAGPVIWLVMIAMAIWLLVAAHGHISLTATLKPLGVGGSVHQMFATVALVLATYGTLMLNFCDFSRFAPDMKSVRRGNFWGLPINSTAFALLSVVVTASSVAVYGKAVTDPAELLAMVPNKAVLIVGALMFAVATMGINVVANFVSPAYDLANVWPKKINFTRGGLISALVSLLVMPWKLYSTPVVINYFLGGLGAFLGPLFGIMMIDYYLIRRGRVPVPELYIADDRSRFYYRKGVNPRALIAFVPTAAVTAVIALVPSFSAVSPFSWFIGVALAAGTYYVLARGSAPVAAAESAPILADAG